MEPTPTQMHCEQSVLAMEGANTRSEIPMADSLDDAEKMVAAQQSRLLVWWDMSGAQSKSPVGKTAIDSMSSPSNKWMLRLTLSPQQSECQG